MSKTKLSCKSCGKNINLRKSIKYYTCISCKSTMLIEKNNDVISIQIIEKDVIIADKKKQIKRVFSISIIMILIFLISIVVIIIPRYNSGAYIFTVVYVSFMVLIFFRLFNIAKNTVQVNKKEIQEIESL